MNLKEAKSEVESRLKVRPKVNLQVAWCSAIGRSNWEKMVGFHCSAPADQAEASRRGVIAPKFLWRTPGKGSSLI